MTYRFDFYSIAREATRLLNDRGFAANQRPIEDESLPSDARLFRIRQLANLGDGLNSRQLNELYTLIAQASSEGDYFSATLPNFMDLLSTKRKEETEASHRKTNFSALDKVPFFFDIPSDAKIELLDFAQTKTFKAGEIIHRVNKNESSFYVIVKGQVELVGASGSVIGEMKSGLIADGIMAPEESGELDSKTKEAFFRAKTAVEVLHFDIGEPFHLRSEAEYLSQADKRVAPRRSSELARWLIDNRAFDDEKTFPLWDTNFFHQRRSFAQSAFGKLSRDDQMALWTKVQPYELHNGDLVYSFLSDGPEAGMILLGKSQNPVTLEETDAQGDTRHIPFFSGTILFDMETLFRKRPPFNFLKLSGSPATILSFTLDDFDFLYRRMPGLYQRLREAVFGWYADQPKVREELFKTIAISCSLLESILEHLKNGRQKKSPWSYQHLENILESIKFFAKSPYQYDEYMQALIVELNVEIPSDERQWGRELVNIFFEKHPELRAKRSGLFDEDIIYFIRQAHLALKRLYFTPRPRLQDVSVKTSSLSKIDKPKPADSSQSFSSGTSQTLEDAQATGSEKRPTHLKIVHSDSWGPKSSLDGASYFVGNTTPKTETTLIQGGISILERKQLSAIPQSSQDDTQNHSSFRKMSSAHSRHFLAFHKRPFYKNTASNSKIGSPSRPKQGLPRWDRAVR